MRSVFRRKLATSTRIAGGLVAGILLVACGLTSGPDPSVPLPTSTPTGETQTATEETSPAATQADSTATVGLPGVGSLAVTGADGNLYVLRPEQGVAALTDNGVPIDAESLSGQLYLHPTWSRSGWLSYVRVEVLGGTSIANDVIIHTPDGEPTTLYEGGEETFVYGYWAPQACVGNGNCERFAYLMSDGEGIGLRLAEIEPSTAGILSDSEIGRAAPFYYSWAPDGTSMLWHQHGALVSQYDVATGEVVNTLDELAGRFLAPHWSPVGDGLLYASLTDDQQTQMMLSGDGGPIPLREPLPGAVYFNWSPDGSRIAYTYGVDPLAAVTVVTPDGGSVVEFQDIPNTVAFFWSPDSTKLAIISIEEIAETASAGLSRGRQAAQPQAQNPEAFTFGLWVANVETGQTMKLAQFLPTPAQWTLFRYFDQYGQSHQQWSPDSRYFAYAERLPDDTSQIRLADTTGESEPPFVLMPGTLAIYSF